MNRDQICLQLYTVRTLATTDFLGTLRAVAEMGYPAVEFAGLHGHTAAEVRAEMNAGGIKAPSAHVQYATLLTDAEGVCSDLHTLGWRAQHTARQPFSSLAAPHRGITTC